VRKAKLSFTGIACSSTKRSLVDDAIQVNETGLLSSAVFGFVRYLLRNLVISFVFKNLNKNKSHFSTDKIQTKQSSVTSIK
jgi:hypothetical protein